jgi:Methyltransferase domain
MKMKEQDQEPTLGLKGRPASTGHGRHRLARGQLLTQDRSRNIGRVGSKPRMVHRTYSEIAQEYDEIAHEYRDSKLLPFRDFVESFSLFRLIGNLKGRTVLDLVCGEGHYTRRLKQAGAAHVHGVDISPEKIKLPKRARRQIRLVASTPLGMPPTYRWANGSMLRSASIFSTMRPAKPCCWISAAPSMITW